MWRLIQLFYFEKFSNYALWEEYLKLYYSIERDPFILRYFSPGEPFDLRVAYILFWRLEKSLLKKYFLLHKVIIDNQVSYSSFWDHIDIFPFENFLNLEAVQSWREGFTRINLSGVFKLLIDSLDFFPVAAFQELENNCSELGKTDFKVYLAFHRFHHSLLFHVDIPDTIPPSLDLLYKAISLGTLGTAKFLFYCDSILGAEMTFYVFLVLSKSHKIPKVLFQAIPSPLNLHNELLRRYEKLLASQGRNFTEIVATFSQ